MAAMSVKTAISRAEEIMSHHPTYAMGPPYDDGIRGNTMNAPSYDCSSFIGTVWSVGQGTGPPATGSMRSVYTNTGNFIAFDYNRGTTKLRKGDILVWNEPGTDGSGEKGHTAMVYNVKQNKLIECTGPANGVVITTGIDYLTWQDVIRTKGAGADFGVVKWVPTDGIDDGFDLT